MVRLKSTFIISYRIKTADSAQIRNLYCNYDNYATIQDIITHNKWCLNVCKVRENMTPFAGNANSRTDFINWAHYFDSIIQQPNFTYITQSILRTTGFPQSWKSIEKNLVMESHWKWAKKIVMEILKSNGISLLLITNHSREVPIIPYLLVYCSDLAMGGFRFMF